VWRWACVRIGELVRELDTAQGERTDLTSSQRGDEVSKSQALADAGLSKSSAHRMEQLAGGRDERAQAAGKELDTAQGERVDRISCDQPHEVSESEQLLMRGCRRAIRPRAGRSGAWRQGLSSPAFVRLTPDLLGNLTQPHQGSSARHPPASDLKQVSAFVRRQGRMLRQFEGLCAPVRR